MITDPGVVSCVNASDTTNLCNHKRSVGRVGSSSESSRTATRPDCARHRTFNSQWNRSREANSCPTPQAKILFLSENRSLDTVEEALRSGGSGYVLKSDAAGELGLAVEAVLHGKRFVSANLASRGGDRPDPSTGSH